MCREEGINSWWTTSARTGDHIEAGFSFLVSKILEEEAVVEVCEKHIIKTSFLTLRVATLTFRIFGTMKTVFI